MEVIHHPESDCYLAVREFTDKDADNGCHPVDPTTIRYGYRIQTGLGQAVVLADMDFEGYSEAGYEYDVEAVKWKLIKGTPDSCKSGLEGVGTRCYVEHGTTEGLSLAYNLKDGTGPHIWIPDGPKPLDLFEHIASGKLIEAWNSMFEYEFWTQVMTRRYGWPTVPLEQLRCAMAKARAFSLPGKLEVACKAVGSPEQKLEAGTKLLNRFSKPHNPTRKEPYLRITAKEDPWGYRELLDYNFQDIKAEAGVSSVVPDLRADELELWQLDQRINLRGCHVDIDAINDLAAIAHQTVDKYTAELIEITDGAVDSANKLDKMKGWFHEECGWDVESLKEEAVNDLLQQPIPPKMYRVLQIRQLLSSASVKKTFALQRQTGSDSRMRHLFAYCGADRTGRFAGRGPQPQNLPAKGPKVRQCDLHGGCGKHYGTHHNRCPWCGCDVSFSEEIPWDHHAAEDLFEIAKIRNLAALEYYFGDAFAAIAGSLRALFCSAPGKELICSDYNSIEAIVLAAIAGEEWRLEVFRTHGKIYEISASEISGIPFEEFMTHKGYDMRQPEWWKQKPTGEDHPLRKKIGKVAELASGYQGWVVAWKNFGAEKYFKSDEEIAEAVKKWRNANPNIVNLWYALERCAKNAITFPGHAFSTNGLTYKVYDNILYCLLPSGRTLQYHNPRVVDSITPYGKKTTKILYDGRHSQSGQWVTLNTYGGKLTENVVQAVSRDILAHAMKNLERAGYPIVLHVHDEPVVEVDQGTGSIWEVETLMMDTPEWCRDWPIKASGGWRGFRYRKD